jgi:hypothetical protein
VRPRGEREGDLVREGRILQKVRHALVSTGRVLLWRNSTGFDAERKVHYGLGLGGADLIGILKPSGRFFAMEVKTRRGKLSAEQRAWLAAVSGAGGFAAVVRSPEEALYALEAASLTHA